MLVLFVLLMTVATILLVVTMAAKNRAMPEGWLEKENAEQMRSLRSTHSAATTRSLKGTHA